MGLGGGVGDWVWEWHASEAVAGISIALVSNWPRLAPRRVGVGVVLGLVVGVGVGWAWGWRWVLDRWW